MVEIQPIRVEVEPEEDGRILASVPELPGVMAYGTTRQEAVRKVKTIALQVLADMIASGEEVPEPLKALFAARANRVYATLLRTGWTPDGSAQGCANIGCDFDLAEDGALLGADQDVGAGIPSPWLIFHSSVISHPGSSARSIPMSCPCRRLSRHSTSTWAAECHAAVRITLALECAESSAETRGGTLTLHVLVGRIQTVGIAQNCPNVYFSLCNPRAQEDKRLSSEEAVRSFKNLSRGAIPGDASPRHVHIRNPLSESSFDMTHLLKRSTFSASTATGLGKFRLLWQPH